jgi:DNA-binding PadR family transcriptional regulator
LISLKISVVIFIFDESSVPFRRLLRHTARVPKGFLRYQVLRLLREKPMSGSEIMEEIESQTGGRWKPSPGSIYPLLAWLQENSYTEGIPKEERDVIKRYTLTEKGKKFFEEQSKLRERLMDKLGFSAPPLLSGFWLSSHSEELGKIRGPARRLMRSLFNLRTALEEDFSDQALNEIAKLMNSTAEKIEAISKELTKKEENA